MADDYDPSEPPTFDDTGDDDVAEEYSPTAEYGEPPQSEDGEEDDDYDPSSVAYANDGPADASPPAQTEQTESPRPTPTQAQAPVAKPPPSKVAGFIVEESDDDDEEEEDGSAISTPPQLNINADALSGVSDARDVSLHSAPQDTATPSTSLNGSTTVPAPASTASFTVPDISLLPPPPEQGKTASPAESVQPTPQPQQISIAPTPQPPAATTNGPSTPALSMPARLPHDKVGQLEDRIKDDPKGDVGAWLELIQHYIGKEQYDQARAVYARFFQVFPTAVSMWLKRIQMENELDNRDQVSITLNEVLMKVPSVELWKIYLDHVRRALPLLNDATGQNRGEILKAFELTLDNVGNDPDSDIIWREYIDFVKDGPGSISASGWQDLQKVDALRKAYQRAVKVPHAQLTQIWKEYDAFELGLHKANGRKQVQEMGPHYMTARQARTPLEERFLDGLDRKAIPKLPPIWGCQGDDQFADQVEKWRAWIAWEKEDPLAFTTEEKPEEWRKRVLYVYKQATMTLYFYPEIWFEAASWCFAIGIDDVTSEGEQFLEKGIAANPESVLLGMTKADRVESSLETGNTDEVLIRNGEKLDVPYETLHLALYTLRAKALEKDKRSIAEVEARFAATTPEQEPIRPPGADNDDDSKDEETKTRTRKEQKSDQIEAVKAASAAHLDMIKRCISYVWVAKMRAFRRVQGQGKPSKKGQESTKAVKGFRGIFGDARPRGPLSSDVYIASALMEWQCYRDPSAVRIFERGMKLFPTDDAFILEYIKHLIDTGDMTNARVVFESTIPKITAAKDITEEQKRIRCRPLMEYMHDFESKYGDLAQIHKIEKRMAELYPDESEAARLGNRFSLPTFDAIGAQLLLSATQAQPKVFDLSQPVAATQPHQSVETPFRPTGMSAPEILLGPNGPYVASPKRPLPFDDSDGEGGQDRRKFMRAESPMKSGPAASVRLVSQSAGGGGKGGFATKTFVPAQAPPTTIAPPGTAGFAPPFGVMPLPPGVVGILASIPRAEFFSHLKLDVMGTVSLLQGVPIEAKRASMQAGNAYVGRTG